MQTLKLPYGNTSIQLNLPIEIDVDLIVPNKIAPKNSPLALIEKALAYPLDGIDPFSGINAGSKVVITVNDKTRPVPNNILLPPLLKKLHHLGVQTKNILILIASGTHVPMRADEFCQILDSKISSTYPVVSHDCDNSENLMYLGKTSAQTPVFVNRQFFQADLRIVVGEIEPHHFAGYSGGVKSAAIGVCGRETINTNHALLFDERSSVSRYDDNPLRKDIEEIGRIINVDLSLNAVLNTQKEIVDVFFGRPIAVMLEGIRLVNEISQIPIEEKYNLVIASAGGYPKDINLYQSQKAMTHASLFCKEYGTIILAAECREGAGSAGYLDFMRGITTCKQIKDKFMRQGFSVGPHKAFQIARIIEKHQVYLHSSMSGDLVRSLLLYPIDLLGFELGKLIQNFSHDSKILILPYATACIPKINQEA